MVTELGFGCAIAGAVNRARHPQINSEVELVSVLTSCEPRDYELPKNLINNISNPMKQVNQSRFPNSSMNIDIGSVISVR